MSASKKLVWFAVLSCILPRATLSNDCEIATAAVSGTCATASTVVGIVGGALCGVTFGIGCAVSLAGAGVGTACSSIAGSVDCGGGGGSVDDVILAKLDKITSFLEDIKDTVEKVYNSIELGFFEQKYNEYINKIRAAQGRYELDVVQKSSLPNKKGLIKDTQWAKEWAEDVLGDGDYNCRGALEVLDEMVVGAPSITGRMTPSVYEVASDQGLCSLQLYDLISALIVQGTTLAFTAMEIRGDKIHEADKDQLAERLKTNNETFYEKCSKLVAGEVFSWAQWSNYNFRGMSINHICPDGQAVRALQWREQHGYGLIDVEMNCEDITIDFTKNTEGFLNDKAECSNTGEFNGFSVLEGREQHGYGIVNVDMLCYNTGSSAWIASNGNNNGFWNPASRCPDEHVITGLEVREQHGFGIINFRPRCSKLVQSEIPATPPEVERKSLWTSWANGNQRGFTLKEECPRNYAVQGLQWDEQHGYGLVELHMDCGYGDVIPFTRNFDGFRNPKRTCKTSDNFGFLVVRGREQHGYGIVDVEMKCTGATSGMRSSGNNHGFWNKAYSCPKGYVMTGMEIREQHGYGIINFRAKCSEWNL